MYAIFPTYQIGTQLIFRRKIITRKFFIITSKKGQSAVEHKLQNIITMKLNTIMYIIWTWTNMTKQLRYHNTMRECVKQQHMCNQVLQRYWVKYKGYTISYILNWVIMRKQPSVLVMLHNTQQHCGNNTS